MLPEESDRDRGKIVLESGVRKHLRARFSLPLGKELPAHLRLGPHGERARRPQLRMRSVRLRMDRQMRPHIQRRAEHRCNVLVAKPNESNLCRFVMATGVRVLLAVLGQALVAFLNVGFLPPMAEWYSGLMPYSALLPTQLLILAAQLKIGVDIQRGWGFFAGSHQKWAGFCAGSVMCYFASMVIRYVVTLMGMYPERRWSPRHDSYFLSLRAGCLFYIYWANITSLQTNSL